MVRALLASLHLLGLGIGLGAVVIRAWALRRLAEEEQKTWLPRVFMADNLWGLAAILWIGTGLARAFGGWEKGTEFYLASTGFQLKMGLLVLVLALEAWPMVTLIRWRMARPTDVSPARMMARISEVEAVLTVLMVFVAGWMARGLV